MTNTQHHEIMSKLFEADINEYVKDRAIYLVSLIRNMEELETNIRKTTENAETFGTPEDKAVLISEIVRVMGEVGATQSIDIFKKILE